MKILYYACHEILEYDEVRLLRGLGHSVFSMGVIFAEHAHLRPLLPQDDPDGGLRELFNEEGCVKGFRYCDYKITKKFVEAFDLVIVMNDAGFILNNWEILRCRPVIWRTVGMGTWIQEYFLAHQRRQGMYILRYSRTERMNPAYLGEDAIIRFSVDPAPDWVGSERTVLTFANDYARRYPSEYEFFRLATRDLAVKIGGVDNVGIPDSIGAISSEAQKIELQNDRAYIYSHGVHIPYTLNFIEAWAAGIPVVARNPNKVTKPLSGLYSEVGDLISHGETGFLVDHAGRANAILHKLMHDLDYARRIGAAGRQKATEYFGVSKISDDWRVFISEVCATFK